MKIPSLHTIEKVVRMVPVVKDLLPSNKDGLNSLIDAPAYKIRKLEDALHDKKAEICKLREKIEELEENLETCSYELNILNNAINNRGK